MQRLAWRGTREAVASGAQGSSSEGSVGWKPGEEAGSPVPVERSDAWGRVSPSRGWGQPSSPRHKEARVGAGLGKDKALQGPRTVRRLQMSSWGPFWGSPALLEMIHWARTEMGKGRWAERRAHWFSKGTQRGREGVTVEAQWGWERESSPEGGSSQLAVTEAWKETGLCWF